MRSLFLLLLILSPAVANTAPFQPVRAELDHETADGAHTGSIRWGDQRVEARLEALAGSWTLAIKPSARRLIDLAQGLERSPLAAFDIDEPVLVFSKRDRTVRLSR